MSLDHVIYCNNVRISFPNLVEPQVSTTSTGKQRISYNCDLLMPPDHTNFQQFLQKYGALAVEKWKEHAQAVMGLIQQDRKARCYGLGQERINKKTFKPYDGYEGMVYLSAGNKNPPQMIQADGKAVDPVNTMAYQALARRIYGGCRVNAAVKPWCQENEHGRAIRLDLIAVQFAGDDKAFGEGAVDASGMFGAVQSTAPATSPAAPMPGMAFPSVGLPGAPPAPQFPAPGPLPSFLTGQ